MKAEVLILSMESDVTTIDVIDWLDALKVKWHRLNGEEIDESGHNELSIKIQSNKKQSNSLIKRYQNTIKVVWYRRTHRFQEINSGIYEDCKNSIELEIPYAKLNKLLTSEVLKLFKYSYSSFSDCHWLDLPTKNYINKLFVLEKAVEAGFCIPRTLITNKKNILKNEFKGCKIITKHISEAHGFFIDDKLYMNYTKILSEEFIESLPKSFFPSLFQQYIEKKYELRVFYLNEKIYSMAIFSQSDSNTEIDYRDYNRSKPNRMVPFNLPKKIHTKLIKLMKILQLNHGSIDLIKSVSNEYVFLEINPVGQFGMVSFPCNYYLEEKVAKQLYEYAKQ